MRKLKQNAGAKIVFVMLAMLTIAGCKTKHIFQSETINNRVLYDTVAFATVANTTVSKGAEILDMLAFFKEYEVAFSFDTIINQDNLKQKIFIEYLNDKLNLRIENEQKVSDTVRTVDKGINPLVKEKPKSFWQKIGDVFIWIFAIALILIIGTLVFKFIYWILFRD